MEPTANDNLEALPEGILLSFFLTVTWGELSEVFWSFYWAGLRLTGRKVHYSQSSISSLHKFPLAGWPASGGRRRMLAERQGCGSASDGLCLHSAGQ